MKDLMTTEEYEIHCNGDPAYNILLQRVIALSYAVTKKEHSAVKKFFRDGRVAIGAKASNWMDMEPFGVGVRIS